MTLVIMASWKPSADRALDSAWRGRRIGSVLAMVEYFAPDAGLCRITEPCRLKGVLHDALNADLAVLDNYTLADLVGRNPALSKTLLAG